MKEITIATIIFSAVSCFILVLWTKNQHQKQESKVKKLKVKTPLDQFGKVEQLEVKNGKFHCLITDGFKNEHPTISKCFGMACAFAGEKYTHVEKHHSDDNYFLLILKPSN